MAKAGKRIKALHEQLDKTQKHSIEDALNFLKSNTSKSFDETLDVAVILGIDPKKSDQAVRGATVLPNGTGKSIRVAVFAQGDKADAAKEAGADIVGFEDLAETIKKGEINFDVVIASPDAMRVVGQLGTILGPKGLMPNPKVGTVTPDVAGAVKNNKSGQAMYRADKAGIVHTVVGKASFSVDALTENIKALMTDLVKKKPAASKGKYIQKISISSTMGPGLEVDQASLDL
ncbi:50S ribosomal protein L1 [Marinicella sp. W31]|uniref:50S ribosomal protein L1 n=1 Tax=Marinicella sp. W31 TaxID=3023713 RepID=UPI0037568102